MPFEQDTAEQAPVNLRIRSALKAKARRLVINLPQTLEATLEQEISWREQQAWQGANRQAINRYNQRIAEHGPALYAYRSF